MGLHNQIQLSMHALPHVGVYRSAHTHVVKHSCFPCKPRSLLSGKLTLPAPPGCPGHPELTPQPLGQMTATPMLPLSCAHSGSQLLLCPCVHGAEGACPQDIDGGGAAHLTRLLTGLLSHCPSNGLWAQLGFPAHTWVFLTRTAPLQCGPRP